MNKIQQEKINEDNICVPQIENAFDEYTGDWTLKEASHLLRRSLFGVSFDKIQTSVEDGLNKTIDKLFIPSPEAPLPINYFFKNDPVVPIGETWVGKEATKDVQNLIQAR